MVITSKESQIKIKYISKFVRGNVNFLATAEKKLAISDFLIYSSGLKNSL